jgi:hypothetical protein
MATITITGWTGDSTGAHVSDYLAAAGLPADALDREYATAAEAREVVAAVRPDADGVGPVLAVEE